MLFNLLFCCCLLLWMEAAMVRDLRGESEFGLGQMPVIDADGVPQTGAAASVAAAAGGLPAFTDAQAVQDGAVGQEAGISQLGHELREIYAKGDGGFGGAGAPS